VFNFMRVGFAPSERGLLYGPPEAWVDHIADMALNYGISAFVIGGDDIAMTERFGAEVAPAARELVARERGR
jgi:hypothetical protein